MPTFELWELGGNAGSIFRNHVTRETNGHVYYARGRRIGGLRPQARRVEEWTLPDGLAGPSPQPHSVSVDADQRVWFAVGDTGLLVRLSTDTNPIRVHGPMCVSTTASW
jgi:streptogramin lyase